MAIYRKTVALTLTNDITAQALSRKPVMTVVAGEIELPATAKIECLPRFEKGGRRPIDVHVDRQSPRLHADKGRKGQQGFGFIGVRCRLHAFLATAIDLLFQVDELAMLWIEARVARTHASHAL